MDARRVARAGVVALACLLALGPVAATPAPAAAAASAQETQTIVVTEEYRLTSETPGRVNVQWRFDVPEAVSELRPRLPAAAENVRTDGFDRTAEGYEWDGETLEPSVTFTVDANRTGTTGGPEGSEGRYLFVDAGPWAILQGYEASFGYSHRSDTDVRVQRRNTTAGPGAVGDSMVFLGPHETATRTANGQRLVLVVPDAADLAPAREDVLDSVAAASDRLRVGDRDRRVLMVAAPDTVAWGVEGLQRGDDAFYVTADERPDTPDNVWLHEYVHTRQAFETTETTRWLTEATAQYYAAQLTLAQQRVRFPAFADVLDRGLDPRFADAVLADPTTWTSANYYVGGLVTGELDRRTRLATDGGATFQAVLRGLNDRGDPVTREAFLALVRKAGGDAVADRARRYAGTTDRPAVWSAEQHEAAFGRLPALMETTVEATTVAGPYRNRTLPASGRLSLVTGERLTATARVENVGGSAGPYNARLSLDGRVRDAATGRLDPDATARVTLSTRLETPGTYELAVGERTRIVEVDRPATLSVRTLTADRTTAPAGETVTLTATVANDAARPGRADLTVTRDGAALRALSVALDANATRQVRVTVEMLPGRQRVAVGDRSLTLTGATPTGADGDRPGGATPGFGPAATLAALVAALALAAGLRRR